MKTALRALIATVVLVLLTGVIYPVVMTAFAQVALSNDADGSLVQHDGADGRQQPHRTGVDGSAMVLRTPLGDRRRRLHVERNEPRSDVEAPVGRHREAGSSRS